MNPERAFPVPMESRGERWIRAAGGFSLAAGEVHVWRVSLSLPGESTATLAELLPADELERAARFHREEHRVHFIVAHAALRDILHRYLAEEPAAIPFLLNERGKPSLPPERNPGEIEFNLSHSGSLSLVALTRGVPVGVDVERIRPARDHEAVARRFFSENEVAGYFALPEEERRAAFFHIWTRKEAYIKALGVGLSAPLRSFTVNVSPGEPARLVEDRANPSHVGRWRLFDLPVGEGYRAALAVGKMDVTLRLFEWELAISARGNRD